MASEEQLKRERGWYLGEASEEAAQSVLQRCSRFNVFVVYSKPGGTEYTLATRVRVEGWDEDTFEHLQISRTEKGLYQLPGQAEAKEDIVAAVNSYVTERDPPLTPALGSLQHHRDTHCVEYCEECCKLCLGCLMCLWCVCKCIFDCVSLCGGCDD